MFAGLGRHLPQSAQQAYKALRRGNLRGLRLDREHAKAVQTRPIPAAAEVRLLIGPANFAAQGYLWARAVEKYLPNVSATAMCIGANPYAFANDYEVSIAESGTIRWGREQRAWIRDNFTHVLLEAFRPVTRTPDSLQSELDILHKLGVRVALVSHGTDSRIPSIHAEKYPESPFRNVPDDKVEWVEYLEKRTTRNVAAAKASGLEVFVSTPDLLDFLPNANWLPTCIDIDEWEAVPKAAPPNRPTVLFAPTMNWLKGNDLIVPVLERLAASGAINYRPLPKMTQRELREAYRDADVIVDQVLMGLYGVAAIQGLAAGKFVVSSLAAHVQARIGLPFPGLNIDLPSSASTRLEQALRNLDEYWPIVHEARPYVHEFHDGLASASALQAFLGVNTAS